MKLLSIKNNPELCEMVKEYCKENWHKVYDSFAMTADISVTSERFLQTWVIYSRCHGDEAQRIIGFCQLDEQDHLTIHTGL